MKEFKLSEEDTCKAAIRHYGPRHQLDKLVEEMAELTKEVCKYHDNMDNMEALAEETADLEICIAQLKMIFGFADKVAEYKKIKLQRLKERLGMVPVTRKVSAVIKESKNG